MSDPSRRVVVAAAASAIVVSALAVVTNIATSQVPRALRVLVPPSRAWILTGLLLVMNAVLAAMAARSGQRPRRTSTPQQVEDAADMLADRTQNAWSQQAAVWRLQAPAPVRVRWEWAGDDVAVKLGEINKIPQTGTGPKPLPGAEPGGVLSSGLVTRLHDRVYARLRQGRLILVGTSGAGKTGAMILLLLEALRHRARVPANQRSEVPVPVWLTLDSWDPGAHDREGQSLQDWVTYALAKEHPYLKAADFGPDAISQLLQGGRIALFLDGLDEMSEQLRPRALQRLSFEAVGLRVVLTSRPDEYRIALQKGQSLPYAAVVDLQPVGPAAAADYLLADRVGVARQTWQKIANRLQADPQGVLAQVLATPLTLSLARSADPDPSWMLSPEIDNPVVLRGLLWEQSLINAYPHASERAEAVGWLAWIAHRMNSMPAGATRTLSLWDMSKFLSRRQLDLLAGLLAGLMAGLIAGLIAALGVGLGGWLLVGLSLQLLEALMRVLAAGLLVGLLFGPLFGLVPIYWMGPARAVTWTLGIRLVDKVWPLPHRVASPRSAYRSELRIQILGGLIGGLAISIPGAILFNTISNWLWHRTELKAPSVVDMTSGLAMGLFLGLLLGLQVGLRGTFPDESGWPLVVAETWFWLRRKRVRFLPLLEAAVELQVLRRTGRVYQFRHTELQDRLAELHERHCSARTCLAPTSIDIRGSAFGGGLEHDTEGGPQAPHSIC